MKRWLLVLLTAILTFVGTEFYLHNRVVMLMWGQIRGYQITLEEKEEELAAKRIAFAEVQKEKNRWIFECIRLKEKLERTKIKPEKQNYSNKL